ncbi:DUF4272 domain-containing protein [Dyella terrae]|uniref:DUF4272 domain-containing protein n=1 Tax=Dyella terrae TaxID=522259 RepID=UPI001EFE158C|nr:DUF4272 domain-containing protein [Dyella terrae]ULU25912.1 DUF4272 protein [Dyella terrae]
MLNRLKSMLAGAKPDLPSDEGRLLNAYATTASPPALNFPHTLLGQRDLRDPELSAHLHGFIGYVLSRGDGQMTRTRYHLMRHLQRVQHHVSLRVPDAATPAFRQWATHANAVVFLEDGSVRDPQGGLLIDGQGQEDPSGALPYPAQAWERKQRSEIALAQRDIRVPTHLPPLVSEPEVRWRTPGEVARRAMALLVVATYAESVRDGGALSVAQIRERLPVAFDHLSPKELAFLQATEPDAHQVNQMGWRYESLALLAWTLQLSPTLPYPDEICDVGTLCATLLDVATPDWPDQARLRPASELLDALDLHYRLHWLTREAELGRRTLPEGLVVPGMVLERHHALNWLVRFEDNDWDDVDTPT